MKFRLGRHNKQLIYWQRFDEPSDTDQLIMVVMDEEAETYVRALNEFPWPPDQIITIDHLW